MLTMTVPGRTDDVVADIVAHVDTLGVLDVVGGQMTSHSAMMISMTCLFHQMTSHLHNHTMNRHPWLSAMLEGEGQRGRTAQTQNSSKYQSQSQGETAAPNQHQVDAQCRRMQQGYAP